VIRRVVEPVAPGFVVTLETAKLFCQLVVGAVAWSVKLEAEHPALSLLVTETLYVTMVPAWTAGLWIGEPVTLGADRVHDGATL
jgi:hypothetical protein